MNFPQPIPPLTFTTLWPTRWLRHVCRTIGQFCSVVWCVVQLRYCLAAGNTSTQQVGYHSIFDYLWDVKWRELGGHALCQVSYGLSKQRWEYQWCNMKTKIASTLLPGNFATVPHYTTPHYTTELSNGPTHMHLSHRVGHRVVKCKGRDWLGEINYPSLYHSFLYIQVDTIIGITHYQ